MSSALTRHEQQKLFISDCEGPISRNDNAFELTCKYIPHGKRLFTLISKYDDVLADTIKRKAYKAGDTLKLILPFLKTYGVTNQTITEYSLRNILLVSGAKEMLQFAREFVPAFIVSTSYEQYMRALCQTVDFPFENVHCTQLDLDQYKIEDQEKAKLEQLTAEMVKLPIPEIPKNAQSLRDFPTKLQQTVQRLDEIFWKEITSMEIGKTLIEVNPIGGSEKAAAVKEIMANLDIDPHDTIYIGDSITDVEVFKLIRDRGGLTVSFNGNNFAVREAEVAVLSENAIVTAVLIYVFNKLGKNQLINLIEEWKQSRIERLGLPQPLKRSFIQLCRQKFPRVELVTPCNVEKLMRASTNFRTSVRGQAIGKLG